MRILFIILLFSLNASATNYYISNTGSDSNNGTSTGTSWATLAKVSSYSKLTGFLAGDSILLKRGDTWIDSLRIYNSGTTSNKIVIGSYGTGEKPLISGFASLTMASIGGNFYTGTLASNVAFQNTIQINGRFRAKGRFPNDGFLSTISYTTTSVTSEQALTEDYTGAEIVVKTKNWITDVCTITSQVGNTLTFTPAITYPLTNRSYFFIQNKVSLCDEEGDYAYNPTSKLLTVFSSSTPAVKYSTIDTLLQVTNNNYITLTGLSFEGANKSAARFDTCNNISIINSKFNFNGNTAIDLRESDYANVSYDTVLNSLNNAIVPRRNCDFMNINFNYVKNTSVINGLGAGSEGAGFALFTYGRNATIKNNVVDSTGYVPIYFQGVNTYVYRNFVTNFGVNKDDGGGIYTYVADGEAGFDSGSIVRSNIIINGIGVFYTSPGLYLDINTNNTLYDSNFVWGGRDYAVLFLTPKGVRFTKNTIVNTSTGKGFYFALGGSPEKDTVTNNIFYSTDSTRPAYSHYATSINTLISDSNYVLRPLKDSGKYYIEESLKSLAKPGWVANTAYGDNDRGMPSGTTATTALIYYNETLEPVTKTFAGTYIDAKGVSYTNSIVLQPFTSALLFFASVQPVVYPKLRGLKFIKVKNI